MYDFTIASIFESNIVTFLFKRTFITIFRDPVSLEDREDDCNKSGDAAAATADADEGDDGNDEGVNDEDDNGYNDDR